jgi:hypothetical protein
MECGMVLWVFVCCVFCSIEELLRVRHLDLCWRSRRGVLSQVCASRRHAQPDSFARCEG